MDSMRPAFAFALLLALTTPVRAAVSELNECDRVPVELRFVRAIGERPVILRYERYAGEEWIRRDFKNPEQAPFNGPTFGRNCSVQPAVSRSVAAAGGAQQLSFRFRTSNYFGTGVADHLAILLRASFARIDGVAGGSQTGRGLAMFASATYVENFTESMLGTGATIGLKDNVWYSVDVVATGTGVAALITDSAGTALQWAWVDSSPVNGTGYGFAVLCAHSPNASCEYSEGSAFAGVSFEVQVSDIALRWLVDTDETPASAHEKRSPRRSRAP